MESDVHLAELARTIQLAVAPVFLLTALGTILSVLSVRLGRVVDRARVVADTPEKHPPASPYVIEEMSRLDRRRHLINRAIVCATLSAVLVSLLIAFAFIGFIFHIDFAKLIAGLFIFAMGAFVAALLFFLREVLIAGTGTRFVVNR